MAKLNELIDTLDELIKPCKREQTEDSVMYILDCGIVLRLISKSYYILAIYGQLEMIIEYVLVSKSDRVIFLYDDKGIRIGKISL